MLPTPSTSHVPYDLIYEPAEDSFLFLDTLSSASETAWLHAHFAHSSRKAPLLVEIGPGSGVIVAFLTAHATTIFGTDVLSMSVDVNLHACHATRTTVEQALQEQREAAEATTSILDGSGSIYLSSLLGDLMTSLRPGTIDILVFNPPYVPTESVPSGPAVPSTFASTAKKPTFEESSHLLELSYAGGIDGMEITNRLLKQIPQVLSERGVAYVLFCRGNRPEEVKKWIRGWEACADGKWKWQAETVGSSGKTAGWEKLEIVRIWRG